MRPTSFPGIGVPVGSGSERWTTREAPRRVLLVVHNVTSAGRLLDILPLFYDDLRVQLLLTSTDSSVFQSGIRGLLTETELPVLPWQQALETPVDLAIAASFGGELHRLRGRLAVLSHGVGYTKKLGKPGAGSREPGAGSREPGAGSREPGAGSPTFGLSPEWLLVDGQAYVDALVLSHPEQLDRVRRACPPAADSAVLAGDPCFDRMLAARHHRERYRRALGVRHGQRLVVLNSTWNPESLFGDGGQQDLLPGLLPRLAAELPADGYRLAAVLHPNVWHGHGPGQIRAWLDRACRSGLTLIDPVHAWRQALLAADVVLGDFGAVSYYAAALGTPVLLAAVAEEVLDPEAPLASFVRDAPLLDPRGGLREQIESLLAGHQPSSAPAHFTSSSPGASAALLREEFYALLDLPEPSAPPLLEPLPLPPYDPPRRTAPLRVRTRLGPGAVTVERSTTIPHGATGDTHLAVHEDTRDPEVLAQADVILRAGPHNDPRLGGAPRWTAEILRRYPHCSLAAYVTDLDSCLVRTRDHALLELSAARDADADPAAYASALHAWLTGRGSLPTDGLLRVRTAAGRHPVRVRVTGT